MRKCAKVVLGSDLIGLHARPCAMLVPCVKGLDLNLCFVSGEAREEIDTDFPMTSLMTAAATLMLCGGAEFRIECQGPDAALAIARFKEAFQNPTYFEGTVFQELSEEQHDSRA